MVILKNKASLILLAQLAMFESEYVYECLKMLLLNKTIFSCEIIVLSDKSNDACITYYLIYDHFVSYIGTLNW